MPEYQNNSNENVAIRDKDGQPYILEPGKKKATWYYSADSRLTKLSDAPLWQPMAMSPADIDLGAITEVSPYYLAGFSGAVIPVPLDAWSAFIMKINGSITVRRQAADGPVEMLEKIDAYPYARIECAGTVTKLFVSGSGTFQIQMYRRPLTDG